MQHSDDQAASPGHAASPGQTASPGQSAAGHPTPTDYWENHYGERDRIWSGNANQALVRESADLVPGVALDLGCGEGADAIWLASRGWRVTAVDVSTVALDRGRRAADAAGVGEAIDWQQHDLGQSFPDGLFDLVSAQFLHSPVELPRIEILRRAAAAVAPGGSLLIVGHAGFPPWSADHHTDMHFDTPAEVLEGLHLAPGEWQTTTAEDVAREAIGPDGQQATLVDSVLFVTRAAARASAPAPARAPALAPTQASAQVAEPASAHPAGAAS